MKAALVASALLLAACGSSRPRAPMSDGERMYLAKCTSCHDAYPPTEYAPTVWPKKVAEMEAAKKLTLAREERALILEFLTGKRMAAAR